jgi:imidazolonepropionase-like amidohydrolase
MRRRFFLLLFTLTIPIGLHAQQSHVFRGARIIPISGPAIENGVLVVENGKIAAVGVAGRVREPANAIVHNVANKVIMPGLVDTHSHIGSGDGGDASAALHADVRVLDAIDVRDAGIQKAQAGGITTANVMPGSGLLMSGQTAYLKLRDGRTIYDLLWCADVLRDVCGGMKMANGTNPRGSTPAPGTRAKAAALVRARFVKAQEYRDKVRAAGRDASKLPARDLEMEGLVEVLDGRRIVHFHSHRYDDILTALRLKQEFGFKLVLQHATEAWKVPREIAAAGVPVSVIVIDAPGGKLEAVDLSFETGATLHNAGVLVGFHTDDGITDSRFFLRSAAFAVRAGMNRDAALAAMTLAGARMLELDKRIGSLEAGKDGDFIILSGDPLSVATHVEQTWVDGVKVFDLSNPKDREYAIGAYGVGTGGMLHHDLQEIK